MAMKYFKLVCPMCNDEGEIMSCVQKDDKSVEIVFVCPACGHSDSETHYLYRD